MLRFLVFILLLANGLYFAWSQGHLAMFGLAPSAKTEPQRMAAQIKPDSIRPLSVNEATRMERLEAAPKKPSQCLQSPLLDSPLAQNVRSALQTSGLSPQAWSLTEKEESARWIVYMGKYPSAEALAKKKAELRQLSVAFEALRSPSLEPGLSLGSFENKVGADAHLADMARQGVRTARVLQEQSPRQGWVLLLPAVDETMSTQLDTVRSALGAQVLVNCRT